jgi:hypothetical protein
VVALCRGAGLAKARNYKDFRFDHYFYMGQLAESYMAQGYCSVYKVREILYKPKIPWYE